MPSIKLELKIIKETDKKKAEPGKAQFREIPDVNGEIGRAKNKDVMDQNVFIQFGNADDNKQTANIAMSEVIKFNDEHELARNLMGALTVFRRNKDVAKIRDKGNYTEIVSFGRSDFANAELPQYTIETVAQFLSSRAPKARLEQQKTPAFTNVEYQKIQSKKWKFDALNKHRKMPFLSTVMALVAGYGVLDFALSFVISTNYVILALGLLHISAYSAYRGALALCGLFYNSAEKMNAVEDKNVQEVMLYGASLADKLVPIKTILKHPIAFAAGLNMGYQLTDYKTPHIKRLNAWANPKPGKGEQKVGNLFLKGFEARLKQDKREKRKQCQQAKKDANIALKKNKMKKT